MELDVYVNRIKQGRNTSEFRSVNRKNINLQYLTKSFDSNVFKGGLLARKAQKKEALQKKLGILEPAKLPEVA